ncbi:MAG: hypothetical protein IT492_00720 [Gammaproteobacteria bacterium]|nr:hypothetical protein [Gammaproteobacteria bacterium]
MSDNPQDDDGFAAITLELVRFMRFFEQWQQDIDFRQPGAAQQRLRECHASTLATLPAQLAPHAALRSAARQLQAIEALWSRAVARLLAGAGADFPLAFIESRRLWCEGLALAYGLRNECHVLEDYWSSAECAPLTRPVNHAPADALPPTGVMLQAATDVHAGYALYVPESHTPSNRLPLIVALHGAYGHGHEYLWTWMRVAHSAGALLLAPKSRAPTWSLLEPDVDISSVRAMLGAVAAQYHYDAQRVLLSGLSDGGSFAYCLGLSCPSLFSAVAPIAGVLHPIMDALLRARHGLELPLLVVHGARDFIFDVRSVRSHCALLDKLGYQLTYTELPEWGHAYTDAINERLVWPWFSTSAA